MKRSLTLAISVVAICAAAPAAAQASRPQINEGGDRQPCVVENEYDAAVKDGRMDTVSRIFDTTGREVGKRAMARLAAKELGPNVHIDTAPPQYREVRRYETCDPGFVMVEFNTDTHQLVSAYFETTTFVPGLGYRIG